MTLDLKKVARKMQKGFGAVEVSSDIEDPKYFVSTGNKAFDLILDGGIPWGYVTELLGFSQSGKSLFIQQTLGNAMKDYDAIGILVDRENAYTNKRGEQLGIDNDRLLIAKPQAIPTPFDAFSFIIQTVEGIREQDKEVPIAIAIDSISAFGKDVAFDKSDSGRKAKSIHEGLRELLTLIDPNVMLLVANQFTFKIGVMYGDPRVSTAGESMKYYSNVRLALKDRKQIIDKTKGNEVIGNWIGIEVIKTRLGPCFRECYLRHLYATGIDYYSGYARLLVDRGYLQPQNKKEFFGFNQTTVKCGDERYNELKTDILLERHPELDFETYPEYNVKEKEEEND